MILAFVLIGVPVLAAAMMALPLPGRTRLWIDRGASGLVFVLACASPWQGGEAGAFLSQAPLSALVAILVALASGAARIGATRARAADQALLGAMLVAALSDQGLVSIGALGCVVICLVARDIPRGWARLPLAGVGLGMVLFGAAILPSLTGASCILLGLAALAAAMPEALVVILPAAAGPAGPLLIAIGLAALLTCAGLLLTRPRRRDFWGLVTLAQGGVVAAAFGLQTPAGAFAGLVLLVLLVLSQTAQRLARPEGPDALAAAAGLAGLPPFGVFPGLVLVLAAVAGHAPWLLVPLAGGLIALGWAVILRLPAPRGSGFGGLRRAPAWLPITAAIVIGYCLPAQAVAWLQAAAEAIR